MRSEVVLEVMNYESSRLSSRVRRQHGGEVDWCLDRVKRDDLMPQRAKEIEEMVEVPWYDQRIY